MHPFHRISRWNGKCFTPSTLSNAGLTLNLGHSGTLCPAYHNLLRTTPHHPPFSAHGLRDLLADATIGSQDQSRQATITPSDDQQPLNGRTTPMSLDVPFPKTGSPLNVNVVESSSTPRPKCHSTAQGHAETPCNPSERFWEVAGTTPYEMTIPLPLRVEEGPVIAQNQSNSFSGATLNIAEDPFFANDSEDEEGWKNLKAGGLPLRVKHDNRKYDKLHCPVVTVVDTTGIHEMRLRFCQCQPLKANPIQKQLMNIGLYPSSSKRTRTVFTFRVLHHFDITNLEGKTTAWQYYSTLKRLTSNVFTDTVSDRYRELMRALRQWRDLSSRRRAGHPLDPSVELKSGDLALFCPACPQPGVNLPGNWNEDKEKWALSIIIPTRADCFPIVQVEIHSYYFGRWEFQAGPHRDEE